MSDFIEKQKDELSNIGKKLSEFIRVEKINEKGINISSCIKIVGEIHKLINLNVKIAKKLNEHPSSQKPALLFKLTLFVASLNSLKGVLKESDQKKLQDFCRDSKTVETVSHLVNWVGKNVLSQFDQNGDGKVEQKEFEDCCESKVCCCCPSFGKKLGSCFGWLCINVCCCQCGDTKIDYK